MRFVLLLNAHIAQFSGTRKLCGNAREPRQTVARQHGR